MAYTTPVSEVVTGMAAAVLGYGVAAGAGEFVALLIGTVGFLVGVGLTAHGLFLGVETAVAAGTENEERAVRTGRE